MTSGQPVLADEHAERRRTARRGVWVFLVGVVVLSAPAMLFAVAARNDLGVLLLMWAPGLAALIARVVLREGFDDISLRIGGRRGWWAMPLALGYPVAIAVAAYGVGWATGLAEYTSSAGWVSFGGELLAGVVLGTAIGLVFALGEELGWRGYLLTRLIDAEVPRPVLVSGSIWAAWHLPLIIGGSYLTGNGGSVAVIAVLFVAQVTVVSYVFARVRLDTGSVWPAVVLHASWNSVIQTVFDPHTAGPHAWLWLGEQGVLTLAANVIGAVIVCRRPGRLLRKPSP
ncbi:CAAX prenyl protease-like protein [Nocardia tenerifensis]|uniref:CAAX prenyl protease-like protein n=1 Tax=Nocardia tenerifensis TaxID=228006 RepID=A0A318KG40_9NOCA|nr:CPBP family intramembrane glutamic endopeptidase [Nocardia tenerifensis]PXX71222.1 CAAX prenyl protease-like protein [Nocardia tenerifensis]